MHVLHLIDSLGLGGAERMLVDLANATVADGHTVSVCVTRARVDIAAELSPSIELLVLARQRRFDAVASLRLARWIKRRGIEVVHVHLRSSLTYVLLLRALGAVRVPIVFHDHYGTIEVDTSVPAWFRVGHRMIDHYVGVYDKLCEWAQRAGMPAAKTTTIPNALDLARLTTTSRTDLRALLTAPPDALVAVMVATVRRDKGLETMIDAVARARYRDHLRVAVIGATVGEPSYAADCERRVHEHGLGSRITFLGGRTDVPALLPTADVALLSSHTESGPLVLIEYLAAGLPIVSTLVGDIGRRLEALAIPGFVAARDVDAFSVALDDVLTLSPAARRARGEHGRAMVTAAWDIRGVMPRWYAIYRDVIARR
jgi:glycosyltransferase involved in cell wall biosynthesis